MEFGDGLMYRIPPYPAVKDPNMRVCTRALTPEQVLLFRQLGDEYVTKFGKPGYVGFNISSQERHEKRRCQVGWLNHPMHDRRLCIMYDLMAEIAQSANADTWQYDIDGYYDMLQYVHYTARENDGPDDHFSWHMDKGDDWRRPQRKLAVVAILSSLNEYEGGGLSIFDGQEISLVALEMGTVLVFPSFVQHKVAPITKGLRRTLVGWLCGPRFK